MIRSIKVSGELTQKVKALHHRTFTFKEGLNVIVGPNGIGKTTLLRTLATHVGIAKGGWSRPLNSHNASGLPFDPKNVDEILSSASPGKLSAEIDWDGAPALMQHSGDADQRKFGYFFASPDDSDDGMTDMQMQVAMMTGRYSSGEIRSIKTNKLVDALAKGHPNWPPDAKKESSATEKMTGDYLRNALESGKGTRNTLILDEPENSLSVDNQIVLWTGFLPQLAAKWQVIVATQNPLPFFLPFVHKVELAEGFSRKIVTQFSQVITAALSVSAGAESPAPAPKRKKNSK